MGLIWKKTPWCLMLTVIFISTTVTEGTRRVTGINPYHAGTGGGVQLTVTGDGFAGNYTIEQKPGMGTEVSLIGLDGMSSYPCDVIQGYNAPYSVVAETRKMPKGEYRVSVSVDGVPVDDICARCTVKVDAWYTPTITEAYSDGLSSPPHRTRPNAMLLAYGKILAAYYDSTLLERNATNDVIQKRTRTRFGQSECKMTDDNGDLYELRLDGVEGESRYGQFRCKSTSKYVGAHNLTFLIESPYGRSLPDRNLLRVDPANRIGMFHIYPEIQSITPQSGSEGGGTDITVTGAGLGKGDVSFQVGGKAAEITSKIENEDGTAQTIVIRPQNKTTGSVYQGNGGVKVAWWNQTQLPANLSEAKSIVASQPAPDYTEWTDISAANHTGGAPFVIGTLSFFFVPSLTGDYQFYLQTNTETTEATLDLSTAPNDPSQKTTLLSGPTSFDGTTADPNITLNQGEAYYVEIFFYGTRGAYVEGYAFSSFSIFNEGQVSGALDEQQEIQTASDVVPEIQLLNLTLFPNTSKTAVHDVYELVVEKPDLPFRLCIAKACTAEMSTGTLSAGGLEQELEQAASLHADENVIVTTPGDYNFTITIESNNGPITMEVEDTNNVATLTHTTVGESSEEKVVYSVGGLRSSALEPNASEEELEDGLLQLCIVHCSSKLMPPVATGQLYYKMDYEAPGQGVSDDEPFCGRQSWRTRGDSIRLYHYSSTSNTPISSKTFTHIGFAYKGKFVPHLRVRMRVRTASLDATTWRNIPYTFDNDGQWHFANIDLLQKIADLYNDEIQVALIYQIFIYKYSYYPREYISVDDFYSGVANSAINHTDLIYRRVLPQFRCKSLTVNKQADFVYQVTMTPYECAIPDLLSSTPAVSVTSVQKASAPITGTFSLSWNTKTASSIAADVDEVSMKSLIEAHLKTANAVVERSGTCAGYTWGVKWQEFSGGQAQMTVDSSSLVGPNARATVVNRQAGGMLYKPLTCGFLRTVTDTPQVVAYVDGLPSTCVGEVSGGCVFEFLAALTPSVSSITPNSGKATDILTIDGSGFSSTSSMNSVTIGSAPCTVTSATTSQLVCTLGAGKIGTYTPLVYVTPNGKPSVNTLSFEYQHSISDINPKSGSEVGCTLMNITGSGFDDTATVTVGGTDCPVKAVTTTWITCEVPAGSGTQNVVVSISSKTASSPSTFTYVSPIAITSINATSAIPSGGEVVALTSAGFGSAPPVVWIGTKKALIQSYSSTKIEIILPPLEHGTHDVKVLFGDMGCAAQSGSLPQIAVDFTLVDVSPSVCSSYGGCIFSIAGSGFPTDKPEEKLEIKIGPTPCRPLPGTTSSLLTCQMDAVDTGRKIVYVDGHWEPNDINLQVGDCADWQWEIPYGTRHKIGVYETEDPTKTTTKTNGFDSGTPVSAGKYKRCFSQTGTYYYWSGYVDEYGTIAARGVVTVVPREAEKVSLVLKINGITAHTNYAANTITPDTTCPNTACHSLTATPPLEIILDPCYAQSLTSMTPSNGNAATPLSFVGTGFGTNNNCVKVSVGDHDCVVSSPMTNTAASCTIDHQNTLKPGAHAVTFNVLPKGFPLADPAVESTFFYEMVVKSASPAEGSTRGGTRLTLQGYGFCDASDMEVTIGNIVCELQAVSYTSIECITKDGVPSAPIMVTCSEFQVPCDPACDFSATASKTPEVTSISPSPVACSGSVTIDGAGFGTTPADITVKFGDQAATVVSVNDAQISCTSPCLPVTEQQVQVLVQSKGYATGTFTIKASALVSSATPDQGSINGGTSLVIAGNGFDCSDISVGLSGGVCSIVQCSPGSVTCTTPPVTAAGTHPLTILSAGMSFVTAETFEYSSTATPTVSTVLPAQGVVGDTVTITGTLFSTTTSENTVTVGDEVWNVTHATTTQLTCTVTEDAPGTYEVGVKVNNKGHATSSQTFVYELGLTSVTPSTGSYGGNLTVTLAGTGLTAAAEVTFDGEMCTSVTEVSSGVTCLIPARTQLTGDTVSTVSVKSGAQTVTLPPGVTFTYQGAKTPEVTNVSPRRGGTAGGNTVTVTGSNFGSTCSDLSVKIDHVTCAVQSCNDNQVTCVTGPISSQVPWRTRCTDALTDAKNVIVHRELCGNAVITMATDGRPMFQYVDLWSKEYTWGGPKYGLPRTGDLVVIQPGQIVLLDTQTPVFKMVLIQGCLIFDDVAAQTATVTLEAEYIMVVNGGYMQVGTKEDPFTGRADIVLHGHARSTELPIYGSKVIGVREGTLEIHGAPVDVTWTLLSSTAGAGDTSISLTTPVSWKVDDLIVVATTGDHKSQKETETRTITAVSADHRTLTLDSPLTYEHLGVTETYGQGSDSVTLRIRAEVGLLSRNVRIMGSEHVEFNDTIPACPDGFDPGEFATQTCFQGRHGEEPETDGIGVHLLVHPPTRDSKAAIALLAFAEIYNAGQEFRLGRYPVHFHNGGDMNGSYVHGCTIRNTHNRAINIHGSHHLLVQHNVVYNVRGGAFFLEDSAETGNRFEYNLLLFVRASTSLLTDDLTPAGFWITRMVNNVVNHNHVAGGTHFGFWYRMLRTPSGSNLDPSIRPQTETMGPHGRFFNNTAHSQGWYGLWVFEFYFPKEAPAVFENLIAWNCFRGAEWGEGGAIQFDGFVTANNFKAGIEMLFVHLSDADRYSLSKGAVVKNSHIIGHFNMNEHPSCTTRGLVLPFGSGLLVHNVSFINFDGKQNIQGQTCSAIGTVKITCVCSVRCAAYNYKFQNIKWVNTNSKTYMEWHSQVELEDNDGSLTGQGAGSRVISQSDLFGNKCPQSTEWSTGIYPGCVCPASENVDVIRLTFNEPVPESLVFKNVIVGNSMGNATLLWDRQRSTNAKGWIVALPANTKHWMQWENAGHIYNFSYRGSFYGMEQGNWIVMEHKLTQILKDEFEILPSNPGNAGRSVAPLSYSDNDHGDYAFDNATKTLSYIVAKKTNTPAHEDLPFFVRSKPDEVSNNESLVAVEESRPSNALLWSADSTWTRTSPIWKKLDGTIGTGKPEAHAVVIINSGEWLVLDEQPPVLNTIEVRKGTLEVDTTLSATLSLVYLYVARQGGFVAGFPDKPLTGKFCIELMGNHLTPDFPRTDGPYIGSKVLAFFGRADFHGMAPNVYWTKLSQTAARGTDQVVLVDTVDWAVGDEVVITATSFSVHETEVRSITAINGKTLTLNETLNYKHIKFEDSACASSVSKGCVMTGEVGLLTRNVQIKGHDDGSLFKQSFGARVLVGLQTDFSDLTATNFLAARGSLRISNTEFYRTGQEGWVAKFDARCSLSYMDSGLVSEFKPSYISGNSFHQTFAQGICVYGATGMNITNNVLCGFVGEGIKSDATNLRVLSNLLALSTWPGAYQDRKETSNKNYEAAVDIRDANDVTLIGNVVSAAERVGYRIDGETCKNYGLGKGTLVWRNNEVHSGLIGVAIFPIPQDGMVHEDCSLISGFNIWRQWGYGVYTQTNLSVIISNSVLCENTVSVFTMLTLPNVYNSAPEPKTATLSDSTVVGLTSEFDCSADRPQSPDDNIDLASTGKAWMWNAGKKLGRTGISFPLCSSGGNLWPFKPFNLGKKAPKHYCRMYVKSVCIAHFNAKCDGVRDFAFADNPLSPDIQHPIELAQITTDDMDVDSRAYYEIPDVGLVKQTECGTMDCNGMKKLLIKDTDGTFLGAPGAILPKSDYEWDGDPRRGLGDYRIPTAMEVDINGQRIPFSDIYDNRGIYGTHSNSWNPVGRTFTVFKDYEMFTVQSLDADNITRVLSPVALRSRKPDPDPSIDWYQLDIINQLKNYGICTGYACNERGALFPAIVATGVAYDLFFTGSPPQNMAINFPFTKDTQAFLLCIYIPVPQRLDVYSVTDSERYVLPKNAYYHPVTGRITYNATYNQGPLPSISTDISGASLYDQITKQLSIVVKGPHRIFIKTKQAVVFKSGLQMTIDEFFDEKRIVENMANFFGLPWYKVRLVNVVSASETTTGRKRRSTRTRRQATEFIEIIVEIADPPDDSGSTTLGYTELTNIYNLIAEAVQDGSLAKGLGNVTFTYVQVSRPLPSTDSDEWAALVEEAGEGGLPGGGSLPITVPKNMHLLWLISPRVTYEGAVFSLQPTLRIVDDKGDTVQVLIIGGQPWTVSVRLYNDTGNADLLGTTTVPFVKGWANFTDLAISRTGTYSLSFSLARPSSFRDISTIVTSELTVNQRSLKLTASVENENVEENADFSMVLTVSDTDGTVAQNLRWKGHVWKYTLHLPKTFAATLEGDLSGYLDDDGVTSLGNLSLTTGSLETQRQYAIQVTVTSDPPGYVLQTTALVHVLPGNYSQPEVESASKVTLTLDYGFSSLKDLEVFKAFIFNEIQTLVGHVLVSDLTVTQGSVIVSFTLGGTNDTIDGALTSLAALVNQSCQSLKFENASLPCSSALQVNGRPYGPGGNHLEEPSTKVRTSDITLPLVLGICIPVVVVLTIIIIVACVMNRGKKHKKLSNGKKSSREPGATDCLNPFVKKPESPASFSSRTALFSDSQRAATATPPVTGRSSRVSTPRGPVKVLQKGDTSRTPTPPPAVYLPPERQDTAVSQTSKQEFSVGMTPRDIPFDMSDIN